VVGLPPQEDYFLGKATERVFLPLLKTLIPDIMDYDLPLFGAFHNCAVVQIKKQYPLHARRVMHAIWGAGQMSWTKTIFVVDDSINPHDTLAVLRACSVHCRPDRDAETVNGPLDILDHAAPRLGAGTKIGFDCTQKVRGEEIRGVPLDEIPAQATADERRAFLDAVRTIPGVLEVSWPEACGSWLFVRADKSHGQTDRPALGRRVLQDAVSLNLPGARFVVVLGREVDIHDADKALFHWVANADFGRDMLHAIVPGSARCGGRLGFDATPKHAGDEANGEPVRAWPPVLAMDREVLHRVEPIARAIGIL
jgi:3-polyprenyl-4-hydroxybenzoate decarboxylase